VTKEEMTNIVYGAVLTLCWQYQKSSVSNIQLATGFSEGEVMEALVSLQVAGLVSPTEMTLSGVLGTLDPCLVCGEKKAKVMPIHRANGQPMLFTVRCFMCGCSGRVADTREEAEAAWSRPQPPHCPIGNEPREEFVKAFREWVADQPSTVVMVPRDVFRRAWVEICSADWFSPFTMESEFDLCGKKVKVMQI